MKFMYYSGCASVFVTVLTAMPAMAQEESGGLSEIIVTAERREQNLQDIPIAATVLDGDALAARGVANVNDLQQVSPSVAINTYNRQTFVNIRGVGVSRSAPTTSSGVAFYMDGVLVPNDKFIGLSFYDVGAIEGLRGPQGTLTGQNSTGGALFIRTTTPEFDSLGGYVDLTLGDYDQRRGVAALNIGGEDVALRIAAVHDERDSYTTNIGPSPSQPGKFNMDGVRASLRMRSADSRLNVNIRGEYFDSRSDGNAVKNRFDTVSDDPYVIEEDAISYTNQMGYRLSLDTRYDISDLVQIRGVLSRQKGTTRDQTDGDRTASALPVPAGLPANGSNRALYPGRVSNAETQISTYIAEVNLLSTGNGPFQWVLGGFLMRDTTNVDLFRDNHHTVDFVSSDSDIVLVNKVRSQSVFGQGSYFVTDQLELVLGGRYSWDRQTMDRIALPGPPRPLPDIGLAKSSEWTGKMAANYHIDNTLIYLSASKGYKAGGTNLSSGSANFGPENNYVYELGVKTEILDRHVRLNGDIFYSDYRDIQFTSLSAGLPLDQNAGKARSWGAELEVQASFSGFDFNMGVGYLNAEFARDACLNDANSGITSPECTTGNRLVSKGDVLPYSPEWTINAGAQYQFWLSDKLSMTPRMQWSHLDKQQATPFPSMFTIMPARDVFDARITFEFDERYRLEAFVNNFTDETYISTQIQNASSADGGYAYGAPRTWGVRLKVAFGD
ncbi:MAG: TonB-dependent receptor [Sphingomonadaceae bacterium]